MIHLYKIFQVCSSWCDFLLYPRPIDIQTSDAGPGVSSHEKLVQIRMAEYFQVFNLDLQARIHYAPNDSQSHIAEQVMAVPSLFQKCLCLGALIKMKFYHLLKMSLMPWNPSAKRKYPSCVPRK